MITPDTWTATYLPTFADDIGSFDPDTLVRVAWSDGLNGAEINGIDTLANSVECMLENTDGLQTACVSKVTESEVEIDITCEADPVFALPLAFTLIFEGVIA